MVAADKLLAFLAAAVAVTLAPGPDILYVLTRGITQGRRIALAAAAGFASGVFVHTLLVVAGLAALVQAAPAVYHGIKLAGAAYLVYLGVSMWISGGPTVSVADAAPKQAADVFRQSVVANVLNPKVAMFFLAFLPRFVDERRGAPAWQIAELGIVFAIQAWACFSLVALAAGWIGERLLRNDRAGAWLTRIAGAMLIALGVSLAWPESA